MRLDSSVNNFISDPSRYLLKIETTKENEQVVFAEEKGVLTWIKAHLPKMFFGDYQLKNVVPLLRGAEGNLKNSVNSVIFKYNLGHPDARIEILKAPESQKTRTMNRMPLPMKLSVKVRDGVTTERDKILELAKNYLKESEYGDEIVAYIEKCINEGILENPEEYLHKWRIERGSTEEFRVAEDSAHNFFLQKVFLFDSHK